MFAPEIHNTVLPIDFLRANESAKVVELLGDEGQVHRLSEMGLRVGALIRMVRPGAPFLLALDGKRLSVRLTDGLQVLVATA
ncbi:FeoA family protein [Aureliella helgolandensis]|uniref:FeoA domain protein n=1 Tax=Aureliella helgolandensis TaxID=2527968 RepID=A0A518GFA8_9BACT|nr:FeoA family protein [Aureliella helgolandensis]QDV27279.1 FeoA domain protein [Aureliella helgolandensis]